MAAVGELVQRPRHASVPVLSTHTHVHGMVSTPQQQQLSTTPRQPYARVVILTRSALVRGQPSS